MRILIFGDSIARGSFDTECGGWANRLSAAYAEKSLKDEKYYNVYNLGVSAETCDELKRRISTEIQARTIHGSSDVVVLILSGTNDSKYLVEEGKNRTKLGEYTESYHQVVEIAKAYATHVYCLGLTRADEIKTNPIPPKDKIAFRNEELERYDGVIQEAAKRHAVSYIPLHDLITDVVLTPDGIHPNTTGHQRIFERIQKNLKADRLL